MSLRTLVLGFAIAFSPSPGLAQVPGSQVDADPVVDSIVVAGDTLSLVFHASVGSSSVEDLSIFFLEIPSEVLAKSASPPSDWLVSIYGGDSTYVAFSALLSIPPDSATGPLSVTAIGLPALVSRHAVGWYPPFETAGGDTIVAVPDFLVGGAQDGTFVGIAPMPADSSATALIGRLESLRTAVCGVLSWGTSSADCSDFASDLSSAATAIGNSDPATASAALADFEASLSTSRAASNLSPNGYWLLVVNSRILRSRL